MKANTSIIILLVLIAFPGCKKENKENSSNILLFKTWKRGLVDKNPSSNPIGYEVKYNIVNKCDLDDTFKFDSKGKLLINRNADKCDTNELPTETVSYSLDIKTKKFVIDSVEYTLIEESMDQVKYYRLVPGGVSLGKYIIFLLQ